MSTFNLLSDSSVFFKYFSSVMLSTCSANNQVYVIIHLFHSLAFISSLINRPSFKRHGNTCLLLLVSLLFWKASLSTILSPTLSLSLGRPINASSRLINCNRNCYQYQPDAPSSNLNAPSIIPLVGNINGPSQYHSVSIFY